MSGGFHALARMSPYNGCGPRPNAVAILNDCTLREGEQSSSVAFTTAERCRIATALADAGVDRVQIALSRADPAGNRRVIEAAGGADTECLILGFASDWERQIENACDAGVTLLNVIMRTSPLLLGQLGMPVDSLVELSQKIVSRARGTGARVVYSAGDTFRAEWTTLAMVYQAAIDAGAEAIYALDTSGCASPAAVSHVVSRLCESYAVPVGMHAHNDLGLGLANALAAYEAGATLIDTCVNGMGDRCGNPSTDEVAVAAAALYGMPTHVHLDMLPELFKLVAELSGVPVPVGKPLLGANAFSHKLDIHVRAVGADPLAFQPIRPELLGRRFSIVLGKRSGPLGLAARLNELGLPPLDEEATNRLLAAIEQHAEAHRAAVTDDELVAMVHALA